MELNYNGSGIVFYNEKEYEADLYINKEQGGIVIKITVNEIHANFLELPFKINFLSGELSTGYKFTLMDCSRINMEHKISEGRCVFTYNAKYMIEGVGGKECKNITFYKVIFELSDIIEWGNISGYAVNKSFELSHNNDTKIRILENDDLKIEYNVERSFLPVIFEETLKENIILKQYGNIEISFKKEEKIEKYYDILKKIKRLIEISTLKTVNVKRIVGWSKKFYDDYGEIKRDRALEIISCYLNNIETNIKQNSFRKWKWIILPELIENNSFEQYFYKYELLEPIIELYLEIINSTQMSHIRCFLNIVQALETYHSRFKAKDLKEFKDRIDNIILKDRPKEYIENDRKFLMSDSKKYIVLESRLADLLLANFEIHFDTGDIKYNIFPNVIAKTRNYYIHYDENIKKKSRVLNNKELSVYNRILLYMLEYYILIELGFSDVNKIKEKLKERWGNISDTLYLISESEKIENQNENYITNE